jgi:hypothetical protein
MANKIRVRGNALVITDSVSGNTKLDVLKSTVYYDSEQLRKGLVSIVRTSTPFTAPIFEESFTGSLNSLDELFTLDTFREFCNNNLGSTEILPEPIPILDNRVIVKTSADFGTSIDSTKEYFIDGVIDMTGVKLFVPAGGINIKGYDFNISQLTSSDPSYVMFESLIGGSGDILMSDLGITVSGTNSKVYDLTSVDGLGAIETYAINYNNCTSIGEIAGYRQGLDIGGGRFGGTPNLILSGTWLGGFRITNQLVRGLDNTWTGSLFEAGTLFQMNSRFLTDLNCDLGTNSSLLDFQSSNFASPNLLELQGCEITRNGTHVPTDTNITPNTSSTDLTSFWKNNNGVPNTFTGGRVEITTQATTTISTVSVMVDISGTYTHSDLVHFGTSANGGLENLATNPREFEAFVSYVVDGSPDVSTTIYIVKNDGVSDTVIGQQTRAINNSQGGNDVGYFTFKRKIILELNETVRLQISNNTSTANYVAEVGSFFEVDEL